MERQGDEVHLNETEATATILGERQTDTSSAFATEIG